MSLRLSAQADYVQGLLFPEVPKLEFGRLSTANEDERVHRLGSVWTSVPAIERAMDATEADFLLVTFAGISDLHAARNMHRKGFDIGLRDEAALIALNLHRLATGGGLGRAQLSARSGFVSFLELQHSTSVGGRRYAL